jgi:small subunit ribosomal protein S2
MPIVTMKELLEAGIHFGHQTRRWHPKMARYIFGQRNGIYIIDLKHTLRQLYKAYILVRDTVAEGGTVLFVGTKRQAQEPVQREATRCGMHYVTSRWLGGTLTNFRTVRGSIQEYLRLMEWDQSGKLDQFGKKEAIVMRKRKAKLEKNLAGIVNMTALPDAMFVVDAKGEYIAVRESLRLNIPCIGIVDTNCDPDEVSLPIPGNDDAIRAVGLFCKVIADAVMEGRMKGEKLYGDTTKGRLAQRKQAVVTEDAPVTSVDVEDEGEEAVVEEEAAAVEEETM